MLYLLFYQAATLDVSKRVELGMSLYVICRIQARALTIRHVKSRHVVGRVKLSSLDARDNAL